MNHFFDVGANCGQTFDDFLCPTTEFDGWHIWCFEPSPRHLPALMEKCSSVADRFKITICPFGLWDYNGIRKLWEKDDPRGDSFGEHLNSTANLQRGWDILVPVTSIAQFIHARIQINDQVTIKIDAEGAEYPILDSLLKAPVSVFESLTQIFVEWHNCPISNGYPSKEETIKMFDDRLLHLETWMF